MIAVEAGQRWKHARTNAVATVLRIDYPDSVRVEAGGIERGITRKTLRRNYTLEGRDD